MKKHDFTALKVNDIALNRVKLRPFVIFNQVLQSGSILHAAQHLSLTQPAVTKAIQELEEQLQVKLFIRKHNGVEPTVEGHALAQRIHQLLAELRYLVDDINRFRGGHAGHIVVGTLLSGSVRLLPDAIVALKKTHPDIQITVKVGTIEELFPALAKGDLDLVVGRLPDPQSNIARQYRLVHQSLFQERLNLVVSKQHPLLKQTQLQVQDLLDYPWLLPLAGSEMRQAITDFFYQHDLTFPHNTIESMSLLTNLMILMQSDAIACMSNHVAQSLAEHQMLAVLAMDDLGPRVDVGYSMRSQEELSIACRKLVEIMHQHFEQQMQSPMDWD